MANTNDVKAGGAYLEITAESSKLDAALKVADKTVKGFASGSQKAITGMGKTIGFSAAKSFMALNLAVGAAKKGFDGLTASVRSAMDRLRENGTEEQRESMARLDSAIEKISDTWMKFVESVVDKAVGPATKAIDNFGAGLRNIFNILDQLKDKFSGAFDAISRGVSKVSELWGNFIQTRLERSPILAKTAGDALKKAGEDAMSSWAKDNSLLDQLDQIDDKVNKSADDIKKANSIVTQLKSRWGDVGIEVDQVTGKITGLDNAQRKMYEAQNKARLAQLKLEKQNIETQQKALEYQNQQTMAKAGPGAMSILGGWIGNTAGVLAGGSYKSFAEIGEEKNQGQFEAARAQVEGTRTQQEALRTQGEALDAQIKAIEEGQSWFEQAGREPTEEAKRGPVGTNTKAGSMSKYSGLSSTEAEVARLNDEYANMLQERIQQIRQAGYSEEEATKIATEEFAKDREALDQKIAKIREDAAKKEAEILEGGASILQEAADANKSDLQKELDEIERRYIDARKTMIDQLVSLGKSEEEATKMADAHLQAERVATDKLKSIAIRRDAHEKAMKQAEEIQKQADEAKKAEIEQARAYVDQIEKGVAASERTYTSSGGTFNAFDQIDSRNIAAESLNAEKEQVKLQKDMVERLRELIDAYEADSSNSLAVFA